MKELIQLLKDAADLIDPASPSGDHWHQKDWMIRYRGIVRRLERIERRQSVSAPENMEVIRG